MRIKEELWVNFMGSAGRNNRQKFEHIRLKLSHCVSIEVHKQPQFTCLAMADMVTDSSLTPSVAL